MNEKFYVITVKGQFRPWAVTKTWEEALDVVDMYMHQELDVCGSTSDYEIHECKSIHCRQISEEDVFINDTL